MKKKFIAIVLSAFLFAGEFNHLAYASELSLPETEEVLEETEEPENFEELEEVEEPENSDELEEAEEPENSDELEEAEEPENSEETENADSIELYSEDMDALCGNIDIPDFEAPVIEYEDGVNYASDIPAYYACDASGTIQVPDYVPVLKFQYNGTCWAHASIALSEISMIKQGYADRNSTDFSELHLAYFSYNKVVDPLGGITSDVNGWTQTDGANVITNRGGNLVLSRNVLSNWVGAADESLVNEYDSNDQNLVDNVGLDPSIAFEDVAILTDYYSVNIKENPEEAKALILENGAIGISYYSNDNYYNSATNSFYNNVNDSTNHAVTVIGWNDNFPAENFRVKPEGNGAWLVRNSWYREGDPDGYFYGSKNSYRGYFWMSYYDKSLSSTAHSFKCVPANTYAHNYQYDGGIDGRGYPVKKAANVFKVRANEGGKEVLESVSFYLPDTNVKYDVSIYRFDEDDDSYLTGPDKGELLTKQSGASLYAGYYTVPLEEKQILNEGDRVSVVVSFENNIDGSSFIGYEMSWGSGNWYTSKVSANDGESFIMSSYDNGIWTDFGKYHNSNIKIKVFTNDYSGSLDSSITSFEFAEDYSKGIIIGKNDSYKLKVNLTPTNADSRSLTFTSSNPAVAAVSSTGYIKALSTGSTVISVKANINGTDVVKKATVNVIAVSLTGVQNVTVGQTQTYKASVEGATGLNLGEVVFSTSDSSVATITDEGLATFNKAGSVEIRATVGPVTSSIIVRILPEPIDPKFSVDEEGSLTITWDDAKGIDYYSIYDDSNSVLIYKVDAGAGHYSFTYDGYRGMDIEGRLITICSDYINNGELDSEYYYYYVYIGKAATVNYHLDGGTNSPLNKTKVCAGESLILEYPTKKGHTFNGWYDGDNNYYYAVNATETKTYDLYAKWTPVSYSVCYFNNYGYFSVWDNVSYGDNVTIKNYPSTYEKPSGCNFVCWNTEADGSGTDYYPNDTLTFLDDDSLYLYPKWDAAKYSIHMF